MLTDNTKNGLLFKGKTNASVLFIIAHPDDEIFFIGTIVDLLKQGVEVNLLLLMGAEDKITSPSLRKTRRDEMTKCSEKFGFKLHLYDRNPNGQPMPTDYYRDQIYGVNRKDKHSLLGLLDEFKEVIKNFILKTKAESVFCFGHDGITGHPEHWFLGYCAEDAVRSLNTDTVRFFRYAIPDNVKASEQLRCVPYSHITHTVENLDIYELRDKLAAIYQSQPYLGRYVRQELPACKCEWFSLVDINTGWPAVIK